MTYHLQFFRQWLRDIGIDDVQAEGSLEQAKALAQVTLETLAKERSNRFKPRTAFVVDGGTREVLAVFRLTDSGPVELPPSSKSSARGAPAAPRLRVVADAAGTSPSPSVGR